MGGSDSVIFDLRGARCLARDRVSLRKPRLVLLCWNVCRMSHARGGTGSFGVGRLVGYAGGSGYQVVDGDDGEEEMRGWGREDADRDGDLNGRRSGASGFLGSLWDRLGAWIEQVDYGGLMRDYVMETAGRAMTTCGPGTDRKMPPQILRMVSVHSPLVPIHFSSTKVST